MRTSAKLVLTALTAAVVLASAVATASAGRLSTSEQSFRVAWASLEFPNPLITLRCRLTLEGSFHSRTLPKVARLLIGAISRAIVGHPCTNAEAWIDNGTEAEPLGTAPNRLPWHVTYESFAGTLPNMSGITLLLSRLSFVVQTLGQRGRYTADNITASATRSAIGGLTSIAPVVGRNTFTLVQCLAGGLCPGAGQLQGTSGPMAGLTNTNTVTITLI